MSAAHGVPPRGEPVGASDTVAIVVGGKSISGWQSVSINRSLLSVPASFDIGVTERYPDSPDVVLKAGDPCQIKIGSDVVLTGYVDRYMAALAPQNHTIRIQGRSKSEDLVDCSAIVDINAVGGQVLGGTTLSIAQTLAKPYGVTISSLAGDGKNVPRFVVNLGETVWEIVDRVTRYSAMVAYDLPDGSVVLAQAGSEKMASGFAIGQNVEAAEAGSTMDQRFSVYEGHFLSVLTYGNDAGVNSPGVGQQVEDKGVPRFRKHYVISEQMDLDRNLAFDRATWERNRRYGTSQTFSVTCDSWRDASGKLWAPNHKAPISAAALKVQTDDWLIASVTYTRDLNGQHADVVMMPVDAFSPEPVPNLPGMIPTVEAAEAQNNPTKPGFTPPVPGP